MERPMLAVRHLSKAFGDHKVIENLSFEVNYRERVALIAPSGSGKTTLIHILNGLISPDNGSFQILDPYPITIFQEPRLFPYMTVEENLFLPFRIRGKQVTSRTWEICQRWLEVCGISECLRQFPHQLSGGMKQKVALIRGMLQEPRFVMMDEPFQSMDWTSRRKIMNHIVENYPETALLFVTHQIEEVPAFAQSVLFFQRPVLCMAQVMDVESFQSLIKGGAFLAPGPVVVTGN